jgi:hypothetical protein
MDSAVNIALMELVIFVSIAADAPAAENPIFHELTEQGIKMSDGTVFRLSPPILPDGLDAATQRAALDKVSSADSSFDDVVQKSYYAPVVVKVRTVKPSKDEGPAVRTLDLWFVAHGDWNTITSRDFLDSVFKGTGDGGSRVVAKAGILTEDELAARKLTTTVKKGYEERFAYTTFSLFERVELSATRSAVLTRRENSILAAAKIDPRFVADPDYPNQWRPLVRDERAEIKPGPPQPLPNAGGYAKITRLAQPPGTVFVEFHLVYAEPYGWFDGANPVKQKAPAMVKEKVRTFRRKLALAADSNSSN